MWGYLGFFAVVGASVVLEVSALPRFKYEELARIKDAAEPGNDILLSHGDDDDYDGRRPGDLLSGILSRDPDEMYLNENFNPGYSYDDVLTQIFPDNAPPMSSVHAGHKQLSGVSKRGSLEELISRLLALRGIPKYKARYHPMRFGTGR